ncbi:TPA: hypothetical protein L4936_001615 [Pseudomonas aeruginosa]|uniref:hypothetical protein n=1 Tax=Aquipseudomonas alcaligenes TaxID=43263 RepID=UPI001F434C25|nr:hypothetical protein [Pseudomonas alcaligenes]BDC78296.1 hypothetical protein MRCP2_p0310 [Pseudomonas alcaligenes]HBO6962726.1 hypothetical protein [Pseudomonas aeruginosa]HBO7218669.1 hypothetical protein [Pseudomonas aeruginosa]
MKKVMIGLLLSAAAASASFTIQAADVFGLPLGTGRADQVMGILQARGDQFEQVESTGLAKINIEESETLNALGGEPTAKLQFAPSGFLYSINITLDPSKADLKTIQKALEQKYGKGQALTGEKQKRDGSMVYGLGGSTLAMFTAKPIEGSPSLDYYFHPLVKEVNDFEAARVIEAAKSDFDRLVDKI